jgi:hypothetical protein
MEILTSWDLQHGKKAEPKKLGSVWQPVQMLPKDDKDEQWKKTNVDWFENLGIRQLRTKYKKLAKNYRLAKGIIEVEDYVPTDDNEFSNIISQVKDDNYDPNVLSLSFYPIIPNAINVLTGEFSKRNTKINFQAVDEFSKNEKLEEKVGNIREYVEAKAKSKLVQNLLASGYQPKSQEEVEQMKEDLNKQVKSLPEIQELYRKNYRSLVEQWAQHQSNIDDERFKMFELENTAFRDLLITDSEFWHINLREDDYKVELWSPLHTFYHKSPDVKYVADGNYVGRITMMSVPDVIDRYGYQLSDQEIQSLEFVYNTSLLPMPAGSENSMYYDTSRGQHDQAPNSVAMHNLLAANDMNLHNESSFMAWLNSPSDTDPFNKGMVRVTEVYWKSQKRVGYVTKINDQGELETEIVTEDYQVINEPIYDTSFKKTKSKETLVFGEHIEWFWINEVWRGEKINTMLAPTFTKNYSFEPIYINVAPLKFQFKAENDLWNSKLPVEGVSCSDIRLNVPTAMVDLMKPYQVIYNLVNNQIKDILIDEIGSVVLLDQNAIPKNSMGEDWGQNNLAKAYVAMKNFQMLPVDNSVGNLEGRGQFSNYQVLNLEQTQRLMSRLQIGEWAKNEALSSIGITPQRLGSVTASESATGTQTAVNNSYSQTESYFTTHINYVMPRVKEMMINAAQYYQADKPSVNLQYTVNETETVMFAMEGYKLLPRDIQVYSVFKPDAKAVLDQMKQMVLQNNTSGANIYDLLKIVASNTPSEVIEAAAKSVADFNQQTAQQQQHEQEMLDKQLQANAQTIQETRDFESSENEKDREANLAEATIKAVGFGKDNDLDKNLVPDVLEVAKFNAQLGQYEDKLSFEREKHNSSNQMDREKINLERQKLQTAQLLKEKDLQIARENKNFADLKAKKKKQ